MSAGIRGLKPLSHLIPCPGHNTIPWSDERSQTADTIINNNVHPLTAYRKQACRAEHSTMGARQPLLPDRDFIPTKTWNEAYKLSLRSSLGDEEDENFLRPHGACAYSHPSGRPNTVSDRVKNRQLRIWRSQDVSEGNGFRISPPKLGLSGLIDDVISYGFWAATNLVNLFFHLFCRLLGLFGMALVGGGSRRSFKY